MEEERNSKKFLLLSLINALYLRLQSVPLLNWKAPWMIKILRQILHLLQKGKGEERVLWWKMR
jgi:hypothetical protein